MITDKIKTLFEFIDFLETNTSRFQSFVPLVNECLDISNKIDKVNPNNSFIENETYNSLNELKNKKFDEVKANVIDIVNQKAFELEIWGIRNGHYELNLNRSSIAELQKTTTRDELPKIDKAIKSYLKFRTETNSYFLAFEILFSSLDRLLKECDLYFSGTVSAKWARIEPKAKSIYIPRGFTDGVMDNIKNALATTFFFEIVVVADLEYEGKTYKDVKQKNNDSILTPENWEQHKETFFSQRMANHKDSYTFSEKVELELEILEKLPMNETDYKILKNRYKSYLEQKQVLLPQQTTIENDTIKYKAKHYVLSYLIECNAKGESFPIGQKKELERIGNNKMGSGKGNRFYKVFNEIVNKDLNAEKNLIDVGGENWRTIVKDLSNEPETIETYLQSKQL